MMRHNELHSVGLNKNYAQNEETMKYVIEKNKIKMKMLKRFWKSREKIKEYPENLSFRVEC